MPRLVRRSFGRVAGVAVGQGVLEDVPHVRRPVIEPADIRHAAGLLAEPVRPVAADGDPHGDAVGDRRRGDGRDVDVERGVVLGHASPDLGDRRDLARAERAAVAVPVISVRDDVGVAAPPRFHVAVEIEKQRDRRPRQARQSRDRAGSARRSGGAARAGGAGQLRQRGGFDQVFQPLPRADRAPAAAAMRQQARQVVTRGGGHQQAVFQAFELQASGLGGFQRRRTKQRSTTAHGWLPAEQPGRHGTDWPTAENSATEPYVMPRARQIAAGKFTCTVSRLVNSAGNGKIAAVRQQKIGGCMRTEKDKMLAGELYDPLDPELVAGQEPGPRPVPGPERDPRSGPGRSPLAS